MHPMKIFPYFYKASETFDEDDITITTLVTPNRFEVLRKLAARYEGPLSVTVHIPLPPMSPGKSSSPTLHNSLLALHALVANSPGLAKRADIHLVISPFPRAFNAWRNIARLLARTTYMLLLDVDFAVCTDWRASVRALLRDGEGSSSVARRVREGSAALVLPAFEYVKQAEGRNQDAFPRDKHALLDLVRANRVAPFHASFSAGHNSTDYRRFYAAKPGVIYKVTQYHPSYEPYVVVRRDAGGWCDERFTGYGGNKAACLFDMYLSGVSFYVLSDHFLVHQSHVYEEEARRSERKHNRRIQSDFKEEACLRYLKGFSDQGILNTTRARNAQEECKKIKGIGKIVMQVTDCRPKHLRESLSYGSFWMAQRMRKERVQQRSVDEECRHACYK
ncbi:glycosyl-transferase for dystroglycan-domain-containing protein [Russula ochroleuca]|uniref:Glycosyl-transferase for dystroglycan-domain-containing protein n=1 Tax=Russula ochroleuca TaxID=152965 RepID=A0A9P5TBW7_9AGAM|nr:glycosyl-transferase for dystroglycan-domain-containing protein [Russula ochroleuca]